MRRLDLSEDEYDVLQQRLTSDRVPWLSYLKEFGARQTLLAKVTAAKKVTAKSLTAEVEVRMGMTPQTR